ncbi:MAG: hypothetical protein Q8910_14105, partial [Bacteroidota bacterium]|nr:hypothetical protein [Bacteroidota bacterium]
MRNHHKDKLIKFYLFSILGLVSFALIAAACWSFLPINLTFHPARINDIITFKPGSHQTAKTVYHQGDDTTYMVDYCKYQNPPVTVDKMFADGLLFRSDDLASKLSLGCHKEAVPLHIPETLPPGTYKYRIIATYQINPLKTVTLVRETNWFTV